MTGLFAVIRWLHEAALMALFGASLLRSFYRRPFPDLAGPDGRRWFAPAALLALITALAWLGLATAQMAGDVAAATDPRLLWLAASQTLFGQVMLARLALLLACLGLSVRGSDAAVAAIAGAALALIAVTGHAAEASPAHFTAIGTVGDGLHLLSGGVWIGGLIVLAGLTRRRAPQLAAATGLFAEKAMIAVALLLLTGCLNAASILLGGPGHDTPAYLGVLALKLVLVAAMVVLALTNHFRLLPHLAQDRTASRFGRNVRYELILGLAVVGLAALLGLLPPTLG